MNRSKHGVPIRLAAWNALFAALFAVSSAQAVNTAMPADTVRVAAGRLSVNVRDVLLIDLLTEVGRQAGFAVAPCAACAQTVSQKFDRLPLDQALAMILRDQSFVLRWKTTPAGGMVPKHLQVLPPAGAQAANPQASRRLPAVLSIGTPESREQAVADLG